MNTSLKTISVVIPVYNQQQYIAECIQSIIKQTSPVFEIIVVNDGSTDHTVSIVKEFGNTVELVSQDNQGVSAARNTGIRVAQGTWILFLDSDDALLPRYIESIENELNKSNCKLAYCDAQQDTESGEVVRISGTDTNEKTEIRNLVSIFKSPYIPMSSIVVLKDLLLKIGCFDTSLRTAEDTDMLLKAATHTDVLHINELLVNVRWRQESLSTGLETYPDELAVYQRFARDHKQFSTENSQLVRQVQARTYRMWGDTLLCDGNNVTAIPKLVSSLRLAPAVETAVLLMKCFVPAAFRNILRPASRSSSR